MPYTDQTLECSRGDSFAFAIVLDIGNDITGATAVEWVLAEGDFDGAQIVLTKTLTSGISMSQVNGQWNITVMLSSADTKAAAAANLYHECKVVLPDGTVSHVATGRFNLTPTANP